MKTKFIDFIQECLIHNNIKGIVSFKEFKEIDKQVIEDKD